MAERDSAPVRQFLYEAHPRRWPSSRLGAAIVGSALAASILGLGVAAAGVEVPLVVGIVWTALVAAALVTIVGSAVVHHRRTGDGWTKSVLHSVGEGLRFIWSIIWI